MNTKNKKIKEGRLEVIPLGERPATIDLGVGKDGIHRYLPWETVAAIVHEHEDINSPVNSGFSNPTPLHLDRWTYTVQEVAERCGRRDRAVRSWIKKGKLRSVKKTGRHMILVDSLNEFFTAN